MTRLPIALLAFLLLACDAGVRLGQPCERASECAEPLACVLGRCRTECVVSRDCPVESECVPVGDVGVCRLPSDTCAADGDCPAPLVCGGDSVCRASCLADGDCPDGSHCALSGSRLLCQRDPVTPGVDGGTPEECEASGNVGLANGLAGFCTESSAGVDVAARARPIEAGADGDALEFDLAGAPAGGWIRIWQVIPIDEDHGTTFYFPSVELESGAVVAALEVYDAAGAMLARAAIAQASADVPDPCSATGRDGACQPGGGGDMALSWRSLALVDFDLREVASVRRVVEVIAGPASDARVVLDGIAEGNWGCTLSWWRREPGDVVHADFDRPISMPAPGVSWSGGGPMRLFPSSACGNMLALDGSAWIEGAPITLGPGPITLTFGWHPPRDAELPISGDRVFFEQGDVSLAARSRRLVARAGSCGGSPALEVLDTRSIGPADTTVQELGMVLDRDAGRLCMFRSGHLIACDETPACPLVPATAAPFRFGAGSAAGTGWVGALDELRIRTGDHAPRDTGATGECYLDRTCTPYGTIEVRDDGSGSCVAPSSCTRITTCPERIDTPAFDCGTGTQPCGIDGTCVDGVRACSVGCVHAGACASDVAPTCG